VWLTELGETEAVPDTRWRVTWAELTGQANSAQVRDVAHPVG
jgi:hypothetical protein